jgi:hypothetical protein
MEMLKITILKKAVSAMLPMFVFTGIGFSPVSANASTIGLPDVSNPRASFGRSDHVPPVDTPALYNGLLNAPAKMPASVSSHTLPGSIGTAVVPVPAAVWLFGSGLLGLVGMAKRKKAT